MKKTKINFPFAFSSILMFAMIVSLTLFASAKAEQNTDQYQNKNEYNTSSSNKNNSNQNNQKNQEYGTSINENASSSENEDNNQFNLENHQNEIKNFSEKLLNIANKENKNNGGDIKTIINNQQESASTTLDIIKKVESRSGVQTFLFGSDYKNLGALRSEIAQTRNRLDQLDRIAAGIQNASSTAEIQAQKQALENEQTKIENFINSQEGKFSLFGWLVKLFTK